MKTLARISSLLVFAAAIASANQAKVAWLTDTTELRAGEPIRTVVKMTIDEGWHVYWTNPGANGFAPIIEAELPERWVMSEMQFPAPIRFMTGELPGFGYEGELLLPVTLTPPDNATGSLPMLAAKLSWLACDDDSCVPGEAKISLSTNAEQEQIEAAYRAIPRKLDNAKLTMLVGKENIELSLTLPEQSAIDPAQSDVFQATPDIVDPAAVIKFSLKAETPNTWTATVPKSEYLTEAPDEFSIVLNKGSNGVYEISTAPAK